METFEIRRPISAAISWTILAEIVRRHGVRGDMRIIEMHPGGGMYDLLTLTRVDPVRGLIYQPFEQLGSINLVGGNLEGCNGSGGGIEIIKAWFEREDPKDTVELAERELGLPSATGIPQSTRWSFGPRMLAALLGSAMSRREYLDARMCFADTSGDGGGIGSKFANFKSISRIDREGVPSDDVERAALCWFLLVGPRRELAGVYRMDGLLSPAHSPDEVHDLFALYKEAGSLSKVTAQSNTIIGL